MYLIVASKGSLRQRHTHVTLGETRRGGSQLQIDHLPFNSRLHSHVLLSNIPLRKPQSSQNPVLSILLFPPHIFHSPWSVHSLPIQIRATLIIRNRGSLASLRQTYLTPSSPPYRFIFQFKMASEQPYDPYIPAGGQGATATAGGSQNGNQRTAALQAVSPPQNSDRRSEMRFQRSKSACKICHNIQRAGFLCGILCYPNNRGSIQQHRQ